MATINKISHGSCAERGQAGGSQARIDGLHSNEENNYIVFYAMYGTRIEMECKMRCMNNSWASISINNCSALNTHTELCWKLSCTIITKKKPTIITSELCNLIQYSVL